VEPDDELTLQQLLEMGITDHIEAIEEGLGLGLG
jgi:hypothetical protein